MMKSLFILGNDSFKNKVLYFIDILGLKFNILNIENFNFGSYMDYCIIDLNFNYANAMNITCNYCFVNSDLNIDMPIVKGNQVIYGFGLNNNITYTSIDKDSNTFLYCLQGFFPTLKEESYNLEIPVQCKLDGLLDLNASMLGITLGILEGIDYLSIQEKYKNVIFL